MTRRDRAVILARGRSSRMGRPKGLCRLVENGPSLLEMVLALYGSSGMPAVVVTTEALAGRYRDALGGTGSQRWIIAPGGGGTARTVAIALAALRDEATHLWLHPVDLPRVAVATVADLAKRSRSRPKAVIVPEYRGRPGHPVVLPVAPWADADLGDGDAGMREALLAGSETGEGFRAPLVAYETADEATVMDFDDPSALRRYADRREREGDDDE